MENSYKKFFDHKHYSFQEIMGQISKLKTMYENVTYIIHSNHREVDVFITLSPTEESQSYKLKIISKVEHNKVYVFPVEPRIDYKGENGKVPHMYGSGALCLYYPKNKEWNYTDSWAETLVPWASLWLYYYENWLITGEWLGGGVHIDDTVSENA